MTQATSPSTAPRDVVALVENFAEHRETYRRPGYNETQLRQDFLDPLFIALGWDIYNRAGIHENYRDVILEQALRVEKSVKAPDYCIRIGPVPKFFVEAKKPAVDIKSDVGPVFQLRRYAWTAKLPLSILTDFEEFAVYDCRVKPDKNDSAATARVKLLSYTDYIERWGEIAGIFSRESVLKGRFDEFAGSTKKKRGTAEVDEAFLEEIEAWRESLAKNLSLRNPKITDRELNFAVQRIIDRIIFLRMCEGRGIEAYGRLQSLLNGDRVYRRLVEIFHRADEKYNSGLFHFQHERGREPPDEFTTGLVVDDKILKDIIRRLYYPESPYEFAALPADILGQVYEQFLGKVIRLTAGHRAKIEEKPEVRKAGGVYYTPTYIVDYIVENTVGKLVEGKTPQLVGGLTATHKPAKNARPLSVLDPACGSGSFLIVAYQYLLDWYLKQYIESEPQKHAKGAQPRVYRTTTGDWRLTIAERKRILLSHIYGVDIDSQAVEVTKLSLLLKVLEGETEHTIRQLEAFHKERALPDLADNVKCGNSLIGPDFYDGRSQELFDTDIARGINAFDWKREFPEIMQFEGFNAVIGNPPWGQKAVEDDELVKRYIRTHYPSVVGIYDIYRPFVERGVRLLAMGGRFGMVLPDIVLLKDYPDTRRFLLENLRLDAIDWWGMAFADAVIDASTIVGCRCDWQKSHSVRVAIHDHENTIGHQIPQVDFVENPRHVFNLYLTPEKRRIIKGLDEYPRLGEYFEIHEGVHSGNIRNDLFVDRRFDKSCEELIFGRDEVAPFRVTWKGRFIRLAAMPSKKTRQRYANIGREEWHRREKLLVRRTGDYVLAAVDTVGRFATNNLFLVFPSRPCPLNLHGLCALLNSRFMTWYFRTIEPRKGRVFAELKIKHLEVFPLPRVLDDSEACVELNHLGRDRAKLAELECGESRSRTPESRTRLERACETVDQQIEKIVRDVFNVPIEVETRMVGT